MEIKMLVDDFKDAISSGLIRQHKWRIIPNFPAAAAPPTVNRKASLTARTTTTPGGELGEMDLKFEGQDVPLPGDRTYEEIPVTFLGVRDMEVLEAFESQHQMARGTLSNATEEGYAVDVVMQLLNDNDEVIKEWTLEAAWIKNIQGMDMDKGSADSYAEFTVTYRYQRSVTNTSR